MANAHGEAFFSFMAIIPLELGLCCSQSIARIENANHAVTLFGRVVAYLKRGDGTWEIHILRGVARPQLVGRTACRTHYG